MLVIDDQNHHGGNEQNVSKYKSIVKHNYI